MKKTFVKAACIAVVALAAGINAHRAFCNQFSLSDFALANIEALASNELSEPKSCYNKVTNKTGQWARYCGTCTLIPGVGTRPGTC